MMPLKALRETKTVPIATYTLLIINLLVFIWELAQGGSLNFSAIAVVPCTVGNQFFSLETVLDFVRTMFLHGSIVHIVGNMAFLMIFGPHIEDFLGWRWYLVFYFITGIVATLIHTLLLYTNCAPIVGASGAISGLLGSYILLYPTTRIRTAILFYRIPLGTVNAPAILFLGYIFLLDLIDGIGRLAGDSFTIGGVAVWAHVGGFLAGVIFTFFFTAFIKPLPKWEIN